MTSQDIEDQLIALSAAHRALDTQIAAVGAAVGVLPDELELFRLKRRKLALKDMIAKLESARIPDGVA